MSVENLLTGSWDKVFSSNNKTAVRRETVINLKKCESNFFPYLSRVFVKAGEP